MILSLAVLIEYWQVTDRHTITAVSLAVSHGKNCNASVMQATIMEFTSDDTSHKGKVFGFICTMMTV